MKTYDIPDFLDPANHKECNRVGENLYRLLELADGQTEELGPQGWPTHLRRFYAQVLFLRNAAPVQMTEAVKDRKAYEAGVRAAIKAIEEHNRQAVETRNDLARRGKANAYLWDFLSLALIETRTAVEALVTENGDAAKLSRPVYAEDVAREVNARGVYSSPMTPIEALEVIQGIAEGSTTANSLPHIAKIASSSLKASEAWLRK